MNLPQALVVFLLVFISAPLFFEVYLFLDILYYLLTRIGISQLVRQPVPITTLVTLRKKTKRYREIREGTYVLWVIVGTLLLGVLMSYLGGRDVV